MRHGLFYSVILGFVSGIVVSSFVNVSIAEGLFVALLGATFGVSASRFPKRSVAEYSRFIFVAVFMVCAGLGIARYAWFRQHVDDPQFVKALGSKIEAVGVVVRELDVKDDYARALVRIDELSGVAVSPTFVLASIDAYASFDYGDKVRLTGTLKRPENREAEGRTFDYVSYLAKDSIYFLAERAELSLIAPGQGGRVQSMVMSVKRAFIAEIDRALPYLESKLAAGLVVAGKHALPAAIQTEFSTTGTMQVVVLSGYNVTIIADALASILSFIPPAAATLASAAAIGLFAVAAGGSATIIRAVIMIYIVLIARALRRSYNVGRSLLVAALLMLIINPMLLIFDASFQLSFVATWGLIYATPFAVIHMKWMSDENKWKQPIASSIATQIFVAPFIVYLTGSISSVALPANLLLSFIVPITMFASFLTGVTGFLSPIFSFVPRSVAYVLLKTMLSIVHFFSIIPGAAFMVPAVPFVVIAGIYVFFCTVLWRFHHRNTEVEKKVSSVPSQSVPQSSPN